MPAVHRRLLAPLLLLLACGPKPATTAPTTAAASAPVAAEPEPPPPPPPKVPADAIAVGTFNLDWAFDHNEEKRTALGLQHRARNEVDWEWKRDSIAKILAAEKLDIIGVQEIGGERELADIAWAIEQQGGPKYDWVFVPSDDKNTGQHVGLLSRLPISNERRLGVNLRKHMAADVELATGESITVVVVHARAGNYPAHGADRRKQARSLKQSLVKLRKERPLVVLGTFNALSLPDSGDYAKGSSVGIIAGAHTKADADDCTDSATFSAATAVDDSPVDRIFTCGVELRGATVSGREQIVRGLADPAEARWVDVPIDKDPNRDVSKHLVLWAEIVQPKKPAPPEAPETPSAGGTETTASQ